MTESLPYSMAAPKVKVAASERIAGRASSGTLPPEPGGLGAVAGGLGHLVAFATIMVVIVCASALTVPADRNWTTLIVAVLGLWAAWLYWRIAQGDRGVPAHGIQLALAVPILVLLGHLFAGARVNPRTSGINLLADSDTTLLVELMTLCLMILLVQDVLSRVHHPRWLLTALGLSAALGAVLQLHLRAATLAAPAVAMGGYAGVGILLAPCWMPAGRHGHGPMEGPGILHKLEFIARVALAVALLGLILVSGPTAVATAILACLVVGAVMLLAGVFLGRHRAALLLSGVILLTCGASGLRRAGAVELPNWVGLIRPLGLGEIRNRHPRQVPGYASSEVFANIKRDPATVPGVALLGVSAGWVGTGAVAGGMALAIGLGLFRSRRAAPGDQARAALWAAVAAVGGAALLVRGGLSAPSAAAIAAVTWGLMPRVMAHHVRRFTGWTVMAAFLAVMLVLGLEQRLNGSPWIRPLLKEGDAVLHAGMSFLLASVLFWQVRSRRWWQGVLAAIAAGGIAALGELAQTYLSTRSGQWSDVAWDFVGASAALAVFMAVRGMQRLESILAAGPKPGFGKYQL